MSESPRRYFIKVQNVLVEVSREVYIAYFTMERREKYLIERDKAHGLLYYDAWSMGNTNGVDYIKDTGVNVEEEALKCVYSDIWSYVDSVGDKYNICRFMAMGKSEEEIAERIGITQQAVNKAKRKLFWKLKEILQKEIL